MCDILLVDMNSFYASVHQALDAALRGKPVIVCGDPDKRHGIVLAASYEAKKYGVKTAMPRWAAQKLVPDAIFIKPEHNKYAEFSRRIMTILRDFSPLVEPASIDEAFVDVSGCRIFGDSIEIAKQIKNRIREEVGVLCSVGIGPNKLLAKMAAEIEKPDGLMLLTEKDVPHKLWPLPVGELYGVGAKTEKRLRALGIKTIGDLANYPVSCLEERFGTTGRTLHMSANGISYSSVNPHACEETKSIGNQLTLSRDCTAAEIRPVIMDLAEKVGYRVRLGEYVYKTVVVTVRDTKFRNHSWSKTFLEHTDTTEEIFNTAMKLLAANWPQNKKIRLVGVSVTNLEKKTFEQMDLFCEKEKLRRLNQVCDEIKKRFGHASVRRGISLVKTDMKI
ncbi:DNA polymerase IV [Thermincola potens]|uniref:DNA polymerase IV n=1 Tax=Thermincola potens (strain JR) TaxID=635013 RepID=D5XET2_THEPJ|nr:DNA polymerase IV [Thermincola potens]ADG82153.1 DNA-directed DNA polymerase [Thermincola potens JR]